MKINSAFQFLFQYGYILQSLKRIIYGYKWGYSSPWNCIVVQYQSIYFHVILMCFWCDYILVDLQCCAEGRLVVIITLLLIYNFVLCRSTCMCKVCACMCKVCTCMYKVCLPTDLPVTWWWCRWFLTGNIFTLF